MPNTLPERNARELLEIVAILVVFEFALIAAIFVFQAPIRKPIVQTIPSSVPYESMINLVTWTQSNGYSALQWNAITELSIFHVWPNANGSITYDVGGAPLDYNAIIATAHSHNVKVFLAFGGDGVSPTIINNILANSTLRAIFINNLVTEVQNRGYDGLHVDFEGTFNKTQFTTFVQQLSAALWAKNPNALIDVQVADWESSDFNMPALEPYATHFNLMFNPTITDMNSWANQLQNPYKMAAGYDFQDDPENPTILLPKLVADRQANYGMFFWQAQTANASYYSVIEQALASYSTSTTTLSTSTASTTASTTTASTTIASTTKSTTSTSTPSTATTTTIPAAKFSIGESVLVLYPTTVWKTPTNATSIGSEPIGAIGQIIANPHFDNYTKLWFYNTSFPGITGWVKEKQFQLIATTSTASSTTTAATTTTGTTSASTSTAGTTVPTTTLTSASTTASTASSTASTSSTTSTTVPTSSSTTISTSIPTTTSISVTSSVSTTTAPSTTASTTISTTRTTTATSTNPTTTQSTTISTTKTTTAPTTSKSTTSTASSTSSTATSTTASSTSPSTTSVPTTTIPSISTSNSIVSVNGIVSSNSPININLRSANSIINITSNTQVTANVVIANITGNVLSGALPQLPNNAILLALMINYTKTSNTPLYASFSTAYPCNVPSSSIYVAQLSNGAWTPIPYNANQPACSVSYSITEDPIIGIFVQSSPATTSTTTAATTTISSGGSGGGGSGGGGGGSSKPVVSSTTNGYIISNMGQLDTVKVTLRNETVSIIENYITPTSAGLTINGNSSYVLNDSNFYRISSISNYTTYIRLLNISYIPIKQTITVYLYYNYSGTVAPSNVTQLNVSVSLQNLTVVNVTPVSDANEVSIENLTLATPMPPKHFVKISSFGVNVDSSTINSLTVTVDYPCGINTKSITPFELENSTWVKINPFYVNSTACILWFYMPKNQTVSLMQFEPSQTTSVSTTTIKAVPVIAGAFGPPKAQRAFTNYLYVIAGIMVAITLAMVAFVYARIASGRIMITRRHILAMYLLGLTAALLAGIYAYTATSHYVNVQKPVLNQIPNVTSIPANATSANQVVRFREYDLPLGTKWYVQVTGDNGIYTGSGVSDTSLGHLNYTTGYINLTVPAGIYYYTIKEMPGYNMVDYQVRNQGYVNVSATSGSKLLIGMFVPCTQGCAYSNQTISFEQLGLPVGTQWSINVDGVSQTSNTLFINFTEPVGIHYYSVSGIPGYGTYPVNGNADLVFGSNTYSVFVSFAKQ
ncbi:MAG: hypothetical protein KGI06_05685 [Candidatus Micrarchaeota archaeon]|nr:hypothetical protein [Candidatus Micrarchaeota archaeon]